MIDLKIHEWYYDTFYKSRVRYFGKEVNTADQTLSRFVFMCDEPSYMEIIYTKEQTEKYITNLK